jgi:class 3 adenylate cyclase
MSSLPSGTVTFLFSYVEGSLKLAQGHGGQWEKVRDRHNSILKTAIEFHDGCVFQLIGDAYCAAFQTAKDGPGASSWR